MRKQSDLITTEQAAEMLGLSNPRTLDNWRSTNRYSIPYVKVGRMVRYRASDIQDFIEKKTVRTTSDDSNH